MIKGILENDLFYCNHLGASERDEQDIMSFTLKNPQTGAELANFAVNYSYVKKYAVSNLGLIIFRHFIREIITKASRDIGIKLIYIFALPYEKLIRTYSDYGFKRLSSKSEDELHKRLKPRYDEACIFMFQQL